MERGGLSTPHDEFTGSLGVMTSDHNAIHIGLGYSVSTFTEGVADDGYVYLELITPNTANRYIHLKKWEGWTEGGIAMIEVVESPTLTTGLTAVTPQNRRRTGTVPSTAVSVKSNPTGISGGTVIDSKVFGGGGAGGGFGGNTDNDNELVLGVNKTYLVRVRNLAGSAKALGIWLFWYEEAEG